MNGCLLTVLKCEVKSEISFESDEMQSIQKHFHFSMHSVEKLRTCFTVFLFNPMESLRLPRSFYTWRTAEYVPVAFQVLRGR